MEARGTPNESSDSKIASRVSSGLLACEGGLNLRGVPTLLRLTDFVLIMATAALMVSNTDMSAEDDANWHVAALAFSLKSGRNTISSPEECGPSARPPMSRAVEASTCGALEKKESSLQNDGFPLFKWPFCLDNALHAWTPRLSSMMVTEYSPTLHLMNSTLSELLHSVSSV